MCKIARPWNRILKEHGPFEAQVLHLMDSSLYAGRLMVRAPLRVRRCCHLGARTVARLILKRILFQLQIQRLMCATVKLAQVMNLAQCFNLRKFRHPAVKAKAPPCGGADVTQFDLSARLTQFLAKVLHLQHHVQFILRAQTRTFHRTPSPVDRWHEPEPLESLRCLRLVPCETKHLSGAPCQGQFPAHLCELPTIRAERSNSKNN